MGSSSVGRASDRHATGTGSIPWGGKGFFSQRQLSVQAFYNVYTRPRAIKCINICVHVKDPVVHVSLVIMETQKYLACTIAQNNQLDDCGHLMKKKEKQPVCTGAIEYEITGKV